MHRIGFDSDQYVEMQSRHIAQRRSEFGGKLYLEFGGKLIDDMHASRVLPGFTPDNKVRMLRELADEVEIIVAVNAKDFARRKVRADMGTTYDDEVLRQIDEFRERGLYVGSVVITQWTDDNKAAAEVKERFEKLGIRVYRHFPIPGYPSDVERIVSDEGYGANEYVETTRDLIVVTAPGDGTVVVAPASGHAYGINLDNGAEVLIHVGLDTVNLEGKGFDVLVKQGDRVTAGQELVRVDRTVVEEAGYSLTTPVLITNTPKFSSVEVIGEGEVDTGAPLIRVTAPEASES